MKVLFLAARDSSNITYANLYKALCRRGHKCYVVVLDENDKLNNKVFDIDGIPYSTRDILTGEFLEEIDCAFVQPFGVVEYGPITAYLEEKKKIVISFANLFMNATLRSGCELVMAINRNKFDEFGEFGMRPRMISIGDPRYDALISLRKERESSGQKKAIKKVLVIDNGVWPYGEAGQKQLADALKSIARNNPELDFVIKLRFLPNEQGRRNHEGIVYLYDFLDDMPPNLTWIDHPTVLEEIIEDYDAALLMWSSAFYAVVALGLPVLFMEGFDSDDVFDVRRQRVQKAYDYLRPSGCVKHYTELLDRKLEFRLPEANWARAQMENYEEGPCTEQYVELVELLYKELHQEDRRFADTFQMPYGEFMEKFRQLPMLDKFSDEYRDSSWYYKRLNNLMQVFTYENRCLAEGMDTRDMDVMYDYYGQDNARERIQTVQETLSRRKKDFYADTKSGHDRIWWFYYFRYLYTQNSRKLETAMDGSLCPEGQNYYQAMALHGKTGGKRRAARLFVDYIHQFVEKREQGVCDIPILRSLEIPESTVLDYEIFSLLFKNREYELIEYLYTYKRNNFRDEVATCFMMKTARELKKDTGKIYAAYNMRRKIWKERTGSRLGSVLLGLIERQIDRMGRDLAAS